MPQPLRVYLEFEGPGDPIVGTMTAGEEHQRFTGWLGLMAGLENAIGGWERWGSGTGFAGAPEPVPGATSDTDD